MTSVNSYLTDHPVTGCGFRSPLSRLPAPVAPGLFNRELFWGEGGGWGQGLSVRDGVKVDPT